MSWDSSSDFVEAIDEAPVEFSEPQAKTSELQAKTSEPQAESLSSPPSNVFQVTPLPIEPHDLRNENLAYLSLSDNEISIDLKDHEVKESLLKKFVVYTIQVSSILGERSFRGFSNLQEVQ